MKYIRKFLENFNDQVLYEMITYQESLDYTKSHRPINNYDEVFDLFDNEFNLYQYDPNSILSFNTYRFKNKLTTSYDIQDNQHQYLEIFLTKLKKDILIYTFDDDWFLIEEKPYDDSSDYLFTNYYLCDTIEGVEQLIKTKLKNE